MDLPWLARNAAAAVHWRLGARLAAKSQLPVQTHIEASIDVDQRRRETSTVHLPDGDAVVRGVDMARSRAIDVADRSLVGVTGSISRHVAELYPREAARLGRFRSAIDWWRAVIDSPNHVVSGLDMLEAAAYDARTTLGPRNFMARFLSSIYRRHDMFATSDGATTAPRYLWERHGQGQLSTPHRAIGGFSSVESTTRIDFRALLGRGHIIRDQVHAGDDHGEWTHAILIGAALMLWEAKTPQFVYRDDHDRTQGISAADVVKAMDLQIGTLGWLFRPIGDFDPFTNQKTFANPVFATSVRGHWPTLGALWK